MSDKKEKLLLIDGHSIINRAFYGMPDLTCSDGLHTGAIYGFLNILFSVYSKIYPDYLIVAFDLKEKTFRHKMYDAYKGGRKPMPHELNEQVPVLKEVLHSMNIITSELPGFEADDILGTYAKIAEADGLSVIILSGDRDLLQLATNETTIIIPKTKALGTEIEYYREEDVLNRYQVTPLEFIDLKALMGDTSDNIPGVPGIGEKIATDIIVKYKSIENAFDHVNEITPKRAKENLRNNFDMAVLSKILATIKTDCPVTEDYKQGKCFDESIFYNPKSYKIFKRLELNRLLSRFNSDSIGRASDPYIEYDILSFSEFRNKLDSISKNSGFFISENLKYTALALDEGVYIYIDSDSSKALDLRDIILDFLSSGNRVSVFGLKEMLHILDAADFYSESIFDVKIMAYLMNPILPSYTFDFVSKDWLGEIIPSENDLTGNKGEPLTDEKFCILASLSARTALRASDILESEIKKSGMSCLLTEIEFPLIYSLYNMERVGIKVNKVALSEFSNLLADKITLLENDIYNAAGGKFNINSPKQLGTVLFEKLLIPHGKKTKTGYSTSADVLEKLAFDYPIVRNIIKYRQAAKLKSTYADGLTAFISTDGRIHGTFHQTKTATGRISSSDPNLQNIPVRTELGQEIRKAFVPCEGCVFLDADYSQIELRILAHMSDDENLIAAYGTDSDIHKITAAKVFNVPLNKVTTAQRRSAKAVNFGIVYGISSFGLSKDLSISRKQAEEYIEQYFKTYPGVKKYLNETVKKAKTTGFTTSVFGRIRPIPELSSGNFMQRSFGERAAMNSPIQGSAADIMKIATINVDKSLRKANLCARIVLQIHDELLVETPENEVEQVKAILINEMKNAAKLKVNLEVDVNSGKDWNSAH